MSMQKIGDMYLLNGIASIYFNGYQISISSPFYIEVYYTFNHKQENLPFNMCAQQRTWSQSIRGIL